MQYSYRLEQAKKIARRSGESNLIEAQDLLLAHLQNHPKDTDAWLLLTRIEWNVPLEDPERMIEYLNNVLSYDPTNIDAILLLAETYESLWGGIDKEVYNKLCLVQDNDPEKMAMVEYAKASYFEDKDPEKYKIALERSVAYSKNQMRNCFDLGVVYAKEADIEKGIELVEKAVKNVKSVDGECDEASLDELYDYYYKGIDIPQWQWDDLLSVLEQCKDIQKKLNG